MNDAFRKIAHDVSTWAGTPLTFSLAFLVILVWAVSGPAFGFSDTWQLVINTGTTIVTFLMVFLIQNTQNRDSRAVHMKLDELIIYTQGADNELVELENLSGEQMDRLEARYHRLAQTVSDSRSRRSTTKAPPTTKPGFPAKASTASTKASPSRPARPRSRSTRSRT